MILLTFLLLSSALTCRAGWQLELNNYCQAEEQPAGDGSHEGYFRAAVFEHRRQDKASALETAETNLRTFEAVARRAGNESVNILVFPEDGLFVGSREFMEPALEEIPEPALLEPSQRNPCLQPHLFEGLTKLIRLSCMARENGLYVVANYGTRQSCEPRSRVLDSVCPAEGFFALNTNVVLDEEGNFIGRYRKYNLFMENFHKAPSLEHLFFDSPYGRFGVFTCFDMMFKRPAVELVEQFHIDTAVFPTWWYDELPLLTAVQFQDAWSWRNHVNLLASNIHRRSLGSVGSSIFSEHHSVYTSPTTLDSRLLVATLPKRPRQGCTSVAPGRFHPLSIVIAGPDELPDEYSFKQYSLMANDSIYALQSKYAQMEACSGSVCCSLTYRASEGTRLEHLSKMILIARDSPRKGYYNWYEQVCALATLDEPLDWANLSNTTFSPATRVTFEELSLEARLQARYVYPVAAYDASHLVEREDRLLNCDSCDVVSPDKSCTCGLRFTGSPAQIYSMGLYGRIYERDQMPEGW